MGESVGTVAGNIAPSTWFALLIFTLKLWL